MGESSNTQKICSSCGQSNRVDDAYCKNCGASLEGIEAVKIETIPVSSTSETNKVEITETLKASKYGSICCIIIILGIVIILISFLISSSSVQGAFGAAFLIALLLPIVIGALIYMICYTRKMGQVRTFSISDQDIKIILPNKPVFQIKWSEFETVQIYEFAKGFFIDRPAYRLNFFANDGTKRDTSIEIGRDFKKSTAKKIRSLLEQYTNGLNKEYIWGSRRKKKK